MDEKVRVLAKYEAWGHAGDMLEEQGRVDEVVKLFVRAGRYGPAARLLERQGKKDEADVLRRLRT